jgi:sugar/nucleoside kinase (ribokinase family)
MAEVYLYGMVLASTSFLLKGGFLRPDEYSEISEIYRLPGGETGTCATVLASLGVDVRVDGNHIGYEVEPVLKEFYKDKSVCLDSLYFDKSYKGLEDYIIIADGVRSPMGTFAEYYTSGRKQWNHPKEEDIAGCLAAAIDPYFEEASETAARLCVSHGKPYVTIDCKYDSYIHRNAAVSVISNEGIHNNYPGRTREDLLQLFIENSNGLTIMTNGSKRFSYGRKGQEIKSFDPFKVQVVSTLGAGDTFKAGCVYGLLKGMEDDELVRFASACSAVAISRFPLPLNPPKLEEIEKLIRK